MNKVVVTPMVKWSWQCPKCGCLQFMNTKPTIMVMCERCGTYHEYLIGESD